MLFTPGRCAMKLPRFTVRRLMFAVAVVALGLGLVVWLGRRSAEFRAKALFYEEMRVSMAWRDHDPGIVSCDIPCG